jgi:N-sulfoglucosamine sulfohydrolase
VNNLAGKAEYKAVEQKMRAQMESELKAQGDPRMFGKGDVFDKYLYSDEKNRDFYNRFMRGENVKAGWVNDSDFEKEPVKQ